jgi:hypothetical protein
MLEENPEPLEQPQSHENRVFGAVANDPPSWAIDLHRPYMTRFFVGANPCVRPPHEDACFQKPRTLDFAVALPEPRGERPHASSSVIKRQTHNGRRAPPEFALEMNRAKMLLRDPTRNG